MRVRITGFGSTIWNPTTRPGARPNLIGRVVEVDLTPDRDSYQEAERGYVSGDIHINEWMEAQVIDDWHPRDTEWCAAFRYTPVTESPSPTQGATDMDLNGVFMTREGAVRITSQPLNMEHINAALDRAVQSAYRRVPGVCLIDRQPVAVAVSNENTLIGTQLLQLKINSHFLLVDGSLEPRWAGGPGALAMTCTWVPPSDCQLFFAIKAKPYERKWKLHEGYFFTKSLIAGGFFKLPLPNLFEDGRICLGNSLGSVSLNDTLEGLLKGVLNHFTESPWGTDMTPDMGLTKRLFRFNPSTLINVAPEGEWHAACRRVNRLELETLVPNGGTGL